MSFVPSGYKVKVTQDRVPGIEPALRTRFERRAIKRRNNLNIRRPVPFYRWEVVYEANRWWVVAFQNELTEKKRRPAKDQPVMNAITTLASVVESLNNAVGLIANEVIEVKYHLDRVDQAGAVSLDKVKAWSEEFTDTLERRFDDVDQALRLVVGE